MRHKIAAAFSAAALLATLFGVAATPAAAQSQTVTAKVFVDPDLDEYPCIINGTTVVIDNNDSTESWKHNKHCSARVTVTNPTTTKGRVRISQSGPIIKGYLDHPVESTYDCVAYTGGGCGHADYQAGDLDWQYFDQCRPCEFSVPGGKSRTFDLLMWPVDHMGGHTTLTISYKSITGHSWRNILKRTLQRPGAVPEAQMKTITEPKPPGELPIFKYYKDGDRPCFNAQTSRYYRLPADESAVDWDRIRWESIDWDVFDRCWNRAYDKWDREVFTPAYNKSLKAHEDFMAALDAAFDKWIKQGVPFKICYRNYDNTLDCHIVA